MARLIARETGAFGGAGLPWALLDLGRARPITGRQIVETGPLRAIRRDLVLGLAARSKITDQTLCKADPQLRAWRFHAVEQLGRIVEMVAVEDRRRRRPEPRFPPLRDGLGEQDELVGGVVADSVAPEMRRAASWENVCKNWWGGGVAQK